jgi:hypothetical protein
MDITAQHQTYKGFMRYTKIGIGFGAVLVLVLLWMYLP